jgi:Na+-driven multidrug efflux pump
MTSDNLRHQLGKASQYLKWVSLPADLKLTFISILPLILAQFIQRLYFIIDSRYVAMLGQQALVINSVQYNFLSLGQLIGMATAMSCLVFWKREENKGRQRSIFIKHISLNIIVCLFLCVISACFINKLSAAYGIDIHYLRIARTYLLIGLFNTLLQSILFCLDGVLIATGQQKAIFIISTFLTVSKLILNSIIVYVFFSGKITPQSVGIPLTLIALSTSFLLFIAVVYAFYVGLSKSKKDQAVTYRSIFNVWFSELSINLVKGGIPFILAYQLALIAKSGALLAAYQLTLQLTYVLCIPLLASMKLCVRDASEEISKQKVKQGVPEWWKKLFYFGLLPTLALLLLAVVFFKQAFLLFYNFIPSSNVYLFIPVYIFATLIGQIGNALSVPIRAKKASYLLTLAFIFNQFVFLLGGFEAIVVFGIATPLLAGLVFVLYCSMQVVANIGFIKFLSKKGESYVISC